MPKLTKEGYIFDDFQVPKSYCIRKPKVSLSTLGTLNKPYLKIRQTYNYTKIFFQSFINSFERVPLLLLTAYFCDEDPCCVVVLQHCTVQSVHYNLCSRS